MNEVIKKALASVTELRWSLDGELGEKAEELLRDLIDLAEEVRCAV